MTEPIPAKNVVRPVLVAALMCDLAATDPNSGKKTLVGIFDKMFTPRVPFRRSIYFYFKVGNGQGEYKLEIRQVLSKNRKVIGNVEGKSVFGDRLIAGDHFAFMENVLFPEYGRYEFQILFDDYMVGQSILDVVEPSAIKTKG